MVDVPTYERQLQSRRQSLTAAQTQTEAYDPRVKQTQMQLRRATLGSQVKVRASESERRTAKEEMLGKIGTELKTQERLEAQFAPIKAKHTAQQKLFEDYQTAQKVAFSSSAGAVFALENEQQRKFYRQIKAGMKPKHTATEEALQMSLPADIRHDTPTEVLTGMSLPKDLKDMTPTEVTMGMSLPDEWKYKLPEEVASQDTMTQIPTADKAYGPQDIMTRIPQADQIPSIKVQELQRADISFRGTAGDDRARYVQKYEPYELTPKKFAGATAGKFVDVGLEGVGKIGRDFPKFIERSWTDMTAGLPDAEVVTPIGKKETIMFEPPGIGDDIVWDGKLPHHDINILKPSDKQLYSREKISTSETIGGAAGGIFGVGQYAISFWGMGLVAAQGREGYKTYKAPIPTKAEVIAEQMPELSPVERTAWIENTPEGKQFNKEIDSYIKSLRTQRLIGGATAAVSVGIAALPAGRALTKYVRSPIKIPIVKPKVLAAPDRIGMVVSGEEAYGVKVGGTLTTEEISAFQPRWQKWIGRKPTIYGYEKPKIDITTQVFKIKGDKATAWGIEARAGKGSTLRRFTQTFEVSKPVAVADLSKLPKVSRYVAGKLPPRQLPADATSYLGISQTLKGVPVKRGALRLERASATQRQLRLLTRPPTPKEAPFGLSFTRIKPVKMVTPKDVSVYVSETGTKLTKSFKPRAAGKVETGQAAIYIKEYPRPSKITYIKGAGKRPKLLTKQELQKFAVRAVQVTAKLPKPKPVVKGLIPTVAATRPEQFIFAPRAVGGLGRGVSMYYGRGSYELTEVTPTRLVSSIGAVETPFPVGGLDIGVRERDRVDFLQAGAERGKSDTFEIEVTKERDRTIVGPVYVQPPRLKQPQVVIPGERFKFKLPTATAQVQKPVVRIPTPSPRPRPRPKPTPTKIPVIIVPPTEEPKVKKFKKKKGTGELLTPFVRRFGKFRPISKPLTRAKAIKKGVARVRGTLAASLQLRKPTGEVVRFAKPTKEFRVGKGLTLVQRAPKRLGRREEIREILASRRAGVKFI